MDINEKINLSNLPYFLTEQVGLYYDKKLSDCHEEITEQCGCDDHEDTEEGERYA